MNSTKALEAARREHASRQVKKVTAWSDLVAGVGLMLFVYSATSREPILGNRRSTEWRWQLYVGNQPSSGGIIKTELHD